MSFNELTDLKEGDLNDFFKLNYVVQIPGEEETYKNFRYRKDAEAYQASLYPHGIITQITLYDTDEGRFKRLSNAPVQEYKCQEESKYYVMRVFDGFLTQIGEHDTLKEAMDEAKFYGSPLRPCTVYQVVQEYAVTPKAK